MYAYKEASHSHRRRMISIVEPQISHFANFTPSEELVPILHFWKMWNLRMVNFDNFWGLTSMLKFHIFLIFNCEELVRIRAICEWLVRFFSQMWRIGTSSSHLWRIGTQFSQMWRLSTKCSQMLCGSSSWWRGFLCGLWLWYALIILIYNFQTSLEAPGKRLGIKNHVIDYLTKYVSKCSKNTRLYSVTILQSARGLALEVTVLILI